MDAKEYYNSTRSVPTNHWTLDMAIAFANEYHAEMNKQVKSLQECKEEWASNYDKTWEQIQRDFEYGMGVSKMLDFEQVMDRVAELYRNQFTNSRLYQAAATWTNWVNGGVETVTFSALSKEDLDRSIQKYKAKYSIEDRDIKEISDVIELELPTAIVMR